MCRLKSKFALGFAVFALSASLNADEGMWLFEHFPKNVVAKKYGVTLSEAALNHMRQSAVRFNNGGTGSFVSANGLLFTNHHVGADCIQKLSSAGHDYIAQGFSAATLDGEKACPDLEVNVLLKTEDVTSRVNNGVTLSMPAAAANQKRKASMSAIEKECQAATGNRCDVVTLFSGGQYHLYQYKKYTDIRLVFAPEFGIAFFGGDQDNFTYPRYDLDIAFFRAYENGKPAHVGNYFKWSKEGVKDGELVFVPGNPGTTGRMATVSELEFYRDVSYPLTIARLKSLIAALTRYSDESEENKRIAQENLFGQQNSYKAFNGFMRGLKDEKLMAAKRASEAKFRQAVASNPARREEFAKFWDEISTAVTDFSKFYRDYFLFERTAIRGSELFSIARGVLRYADETAKPDSARLREYTTSGLPSLEQELYSTAPLHDSLEIAVIEDYFQFLVQELGAGHPMAVKLLQGRSPHDAAAAYVSSSKLKDVQERKRLAQDREAVHASQDGMIVLARLLDPDARRLRKEYEDRIEAVLVSSASKIALARYEISGGNEYPDATFTLRLAYGAVKGYKNDAGKWVPYATTLAGLYEKGTGKDPYVIPGSWLKAKTALKLSTPFNFVTTADTHGGNSGSATINARGEIVGILFDGNIESLPNRFFYDDKQARSVHVASQGIIKALTKVYKANRLLAELTGAGVP